MKKSVITIILSFGCILFLFACNVKNTAKKEEKQETISVETSETTTVPVITVENIITSTQPIQTTSTKAVKLNNKLQGSYKLKGIEFSVPAYFKNKEEKNDGISFSASGIGNALFMAIQCNNTEEEYLLVRNELEKTVYNSIAESFDSLEKQQSKNVSVGNKKYEYGIYNGNKDDKKAKVYLTNFYDENSKVLYFSSFLCSDMYEYDFESDFVNMLKNIKMSDYHSENVESDILQINKTFLSTDWSGNTVLVVEYTWKNTTNEITSFSWNVSTTCFQNGVECNTAYFCDDVESGDASKDVMPGYSITVRKAYEIKDMSDVTIQCKKFLSSDILLQTTIKLS